jgi:outer membrane protein
MKRIGRIGSILLFVGLFAWGLPTTNAAAGQNEFSLKQCIDLALQKNVGVISAQNNYRSAKYDLWNAWGDALPTASVSAGYGFGKDLRPTYVQQLNTYYQDPGSKSYSTGINLSMTLFDGGATWLRIRQSNQRKTAASNAMDGTALATIYNVTQAYYTLVGAAMLRKVQEDALVRSNKQLEVINSKYELGSASLSEKLKAQVTVANDSVALLTRENNIRSAEFVLNLLLNRDATQPIVPSDTLYNVPFDMSIDQCLQTALESNPVLKKSRADYDAAKTQVSIARASWLPSVSARMSWSWSTNDTKRLDTFGVFQPLKSVGRAYSFGVSASYAIFDGFRKNTTYSQARLSETNQRESFGAARNQLISDVRQAFLNIQTARLQHQAAQLAEQSAQEDMKLQSERYRLGASSILELLDAQYSLTNSQYLRIQALYQLNLALASMAKAMGRM